MAKDYFKSKNIAYEEFNVISDTKAQEEMIKKSGQMGVPVLDINGKIIVGFNKPEIDKALASWNFLKPCNQNTKPLQGVLCLMWILLAEFIII